MRIKTTLGLGIVGVAAAGALAVGGAAWASTGGNGPSGLPAAPVVAESATADTGGDPAAGDCPWKEQQQATGSGAPADDTNL